MNLKFTRLTTFCLALGGIMTYAGLTSYSTGNPGNSAAGCANGGTCHGGSASSATILTITGIPVGGFVAGTAYNLTAAVTNTSKVAAGFDLACSVGAFSNAPANTSIISANKEIYHTAPKTMTSGVATWSFTWTAPATGSTAVFNFAGNAVNLNGASSGDVWNISTQTFNAATSSVTAPTITLGAVSAITNTTATINASVNANGGSTAITVQYGLTTSYGSIGTASPATATGTTATAITSALTGLTPGKLYHYRVAAANSAGATTSADATFTTGNLSVGSLAAAGFRMYPNPVSNVLTIDAPTANSTLAIQVTDMSGKSMPAPVSRNGNTYSVQMSGFANGLYTIRINDGSKVSSATFQKQ